MGGWQSTHFPTLLDNVITCNERMRQFTPEINVGIGGFLFHIDDRINLTTWYSGRIKQFFVLPFISDCRNRASVKQFFHLSLIGDDSI
jgi:hypothetical protein